MFHVYNKSAQHPQSNMAKAALNMMTRTSGATYWRRHRIAMNAVDTGLVTNEYPAGHPNCDDKTPLDDVDGAARILDPIFAPLLGAKVEYGTLFKDFAPSVW
jgi:NAD(P)-dependent dehydrogenase (short-subunit alcohol dehydrogenase family)